MNAAFLNEIKKRQADKLIHAHVEDDDVPTTTTTGRRRRSTVDDDTLNKTKAKLHKVEAPVIQNLALSHAKLLGNIKKGVALDKAHVVEKNETLNHAKLIATINKGVALKETGQTHEKETNTTINKDEYTSQVHLKQWNVLVLEAYNYFDMDDENSDVLEEEEIIQLAKQLGCTNQYAAQSFNSIIGHEKKNNGYMDLLQWETWLSNILLNGEAPNGQKLQLLSLKISELQRP